jgi:L-idonate 5-dehydrogenase
VTARHVNVFHPEGSPMRSVVVHAPLDLRVENTPPATDPGPGEVKVSLAAGGICGSDLHYYQHGGFGTIRLKEPMILGHEVAGTVVAVGEGVTRVRVGDRVAVNPNHPCGHCRYCIEGHSNQCLDVRFYGSAMRFPHVQGAFRDEIVIAQEQAFPVKPEVPLDEAAFAEPFSVALHAATRAGSVLGKKVLVTGCGPIGCLTIMAARQGGASEIVVTDVSAPPLATAAKVGADQTLNVAERPDALAPYTHHKGYFDMTFECSGNPRALVGAFEVTRPLGAVVLVGLGGEATLPMNSVVTKELEVCGAFRTGVEFGWAVDLISSRRVDMRPLLTATYSVDQAIEAFQFAGDKARAMKVQLSFAGAQ